MPSGSEPVRSVADASSRTRAVLPSSDSAMTTRFPSNDADRTSAPGPFGSTSSAFEGPTSLPPARQIATSLS
jgi:hypothetical protein